MHVLILGDIYADTHIRSDSSFIRLGGVFHAARACYALGIDYSIGAACPEYLQPAACKIAAALGCKDIKFVGCVTKSPNVIVIRDSKELSIQGYEDLLREERECVLLDDELSSLLKENLTDILYIPGILPFSGISQHLKQFIGAIHLDLPSGDIPWVEITTAGIHFQTIFISTSSHPFKHAYGRNIAQLARELVLMCDDLVLKENRGGSRVFSNNTWHQIPAFPKIAVHSVGVGDAYDISYLFKRAKADSGLAGRFASFLAAEYAATWDDEDFYKNITHFLLNLGDEQLSSLGGLYLSWEDRQKVSIYLAAPDFSEREKYIIDPIINMLRYHNFNILTPVRENGLVTLSTDKVTRQEIFEKDIAMMEKSGICLAFLIYNDPGTLIELGYMSALHKHVLLYDPFIQAENLILTNLPNAITTTPDALLMEVYKTICQILEKENNCG